MSGFDKSENAEIRQYWRNYKWYRTKYHYRNRPCLGDRSILKALGRNKSIESQMKLQKYKASLCDSVVNKRRFVFKARWPVYPKNE